jgi:OOP family OmpA-OmpF porin
MQRSKVIAALMASFLLASVYAFAGDVKGMITSRTGDTLTVKSGEGSTTVVLTEDTKTKDNKGLFGLDKNFMAESVLMPGLKVDIDTTSDDAGRVIAKTVTVDGDDLEASQMIEAGLTPTAEQVATNVKTLETHQGQLSGHTVELASQKENITSNENNIAAQKQQLEQTIKDTEENEQRFATLSDYDVKDQATVKFAFNSAGLSSEGQEALKSLAGNAAGLKGYIVEVTGHTDSTGSADVNTKLSQDRATAVVKYLFQQCNVPMRHIVAPGAMGEFGPTSSNEKKGGRAENRRVEVKVLVNKGVAGT